MIRKGYEGVVSSEKNILKLVLGGGYRDVCNCQKLTKLNIENLYILVT